MRFLTLVNFTLTNAFQLIFRYQLGERSCQQAMFAVLLKKLVIQVILYMLRAVPASSKGSCLTGGFFFAQGRNMVDNHALRGHVFANVTAPEPVRCFRACQSDCRCISFNYQQSGSKDNCQLNEENRYTNFSALEFVEGWQYYDLVIDYNVKVAKVLYLRFVPHYIERADNWA